MARRPSPSLRALLFWCGEGAVSEAFGDWKTAQTASFLVGSESNVRQWGPWPTGPVRPSGPCCFGVAKAPFLKLLATTLGSGARPSKVGPVARRPSSLRALQFWRGEGAVCEAFGDWKTAQTASFLVGSESNVRQWGPWPAGPVRPSGPCSFGVAKAPFVRLLATGRQLRQLVFL